MYMPRSLPPLDSLRVLAACVRHGSFSRAAQELGLTPAAVSVRIRDLEARIGVKLFHRHGPRLTVSDQGALLGEQMDVAMSLIRSAIDRCRNSQPVLRVTCAPTFASRWLVPRLAEYHTTPGAQPIALDVSADLLPLTSFDVAIRSGTASLPGVSAVELFPELGTPMLSPALLDGEEQLSLERLLELPLLSDSRWSRWFARAGKANATPRFATTRFPTYELEALAAVEGVGVALLSPVLFGDLCRTGTLIAPFRTVVEGPNRYWAIWAPDLPPPHLVQWLTRQLDQQDSSPARQQARRAGRRGSSWTTQDQG